MKVGQASFTSGELDPALHARADLQAYRTGLARCLNYLVMPQGGARNRPGLQYVNATLNNAPARLIEFAYNDDDSYLLELTANRMRVYRNGALVLLSGTQPSWSNGTAYVPGDIVDHPNGVYYSCYTAHTSHSGNNRPGSGSHWTDYWIALTDDIFEMYHPYNVTEIFELDYEQNGDVLLVTHLNHPVLRMIRADHDHWVPEEITYTPATAAPTGLSASGGTGTAYDYKVTTVNAADLEESLPSSSVSNNEDGGTITWTNVTGALQYNVYKAENGIYGFIGSAADGTAGFTDKKLIPLTDDTPPAAQNPFADTANYPSCVAFHEQRTIFGGANPQRVNTSQIGNYFNFSVSEPANDADALTLDVVSNKIAQIRYVISQIDLLVFTAGAEIRINSGERPFILDNLSRKQQSSYGCELGVKPKIVGDKILFVQRGGQNIRDFAYSFEADKFTGGDLSVIAKHLFDGRQVTDWAYTSEPYPILWMVMTDGDVVGMTIANEHDVLAFHEHTTDGTFESVCAVPEGDTTALYFVVNRTVNGGTVRYIEKLSTWVANPVADATFLDAHATGTITGSSISGLDHLEGETVTCYIGGDVIPDLVVSSGSITLPRTYTSAAACVGLPYVSRLKTLEPALQDAYGNEMSVARLQLRILNTRGVWAGPDEANMTEYPTRLYEDWGESPQPKTDTIELVVEPSWSTRGQVVVEQPDPLPSYILAIVPDVEVGG